MTAKDFYRRFIAVHKCGGCGEILPWQRSDEAFCDKCQLDWNRDTVVGCKDCFLPVRECGCMPDAMKKAGALTLRKLFFYREDAIYSATMGMIYWIKHRKSKRMIRYVCDRLFTAVTEELSTLGINSSDEVFITYVPRGKASYRLHGFDQSRLIADRLSELTGYESIRAFYSVFGKKQQKSLDGRGRMKNAKQTIRINKGLDIKGRYAVLFDDIVTSGASMAVCTDYLIKSGVRGVICVSLTSKPKK